MNSANESAYWSKEVSDILQISDSTLRKWCLSLEKNGYEFIRGSNNSRAFIERDVLLLRRMKELVQNRGITVENASNLVIASTSDDERTTAVQGTNDLTVPFHHDELLKQLLERQERLENMNQQLLEKLDEQHRYIDKRMEERDRILMESLRQSQEERKVILQIAAAQEEEKKKSFWSKFFGK